MDVDREVSVRKAIKYCVENFDSQEATNRIVRFWKDELELQKKELLIDFMKKTQGQLIWGWDLGGGIKVADAYLRGELNVENK